MFLQHFKMTAHPFTERPPLEHLIKDERVEQGLARLQYLAEQGTAALVIGPTGVGKSSLIRLFINGLERHRYQAVYVHLTALQSAHFLRLVVSALGEKPRLGKDRLFLQILQKLQDSERTTILIVDEAHLLSTEALTDLRLLISSALDQAPPLKILLSAQETFKALLKRASLADLTQRISVRHHHRPLSKDQTLAYIDARLSAAGASEKLFDPDAKTLIHEYAGGVPRQINNIATICLINAASRNEQKISGTLVHDTNSEVKLP